MGKFDGKKKIGLRDKDTKELIAVYPYITEGTDAEIKKAVTDWYYTQNCSAEDQLRNAYVDLLSDTEIESHQ